MNDNEARADRIRHLLVRARRVVELEQRRQPSDEEQEQLRSEAWRAGLEALGEDITENVRWGLLRGDP